MARKSKDLDEILEIFNENEFIAEEEFELMDIDAKFIYKLKEDHMSEQLTLDKIAPFTGNKK